LLSPFLPSFRFDSLRFSRFFSTGVGSSTALGGQAGKAVEVLDLLPVEFHMRALLDLRGNEHIAVARTLQALGGLYPGDLYTPSVRGYRPPDEPEYPFHDKTVRVTKCGRICMGHRKVNLSIVFSGQTVGVTEVADKIWLVSFLEYDRGFFDEEVAGLAIQVGRTDYQPLWTGTGVNHVPGMICKPCLRYRPLVVWTAREDSNGAAQASDLCLRSSQLVYPWLYMPTVTFCF
jgi:putative transposase